jgi:hypothetical protein
LGITIHFEGKLRNERCLSEAVPIAEEYANKLKWPWETIDEVEVTLPRVRDEKDWDYTGPVRGIALFPHEDCEPVRLQFDSDLYVQEYTKTQFAGPEIHIAVVTLLRSLEPLFEQLEIVDEGEYWDGSDAQRLRSLIDGCNEAIAEELAKNPNAKYKVKLQHGQIIDILE